MGTRPRGLVNLLFFSLSPKTRLAHNEAGFLVPSRSVTCEVTITGPQHGLGNHPVGVRATTPLRPLLHRQT